MTEEVQNDIPLFARKVHVLSTILKHMTKHPLRIVWYDLLDVFFHFCPMLVFDITVSLSMPYKWKSHRFNLGDVKTTDR